MKPNIITIALLVSCSSLFAEHTQVNIPNFTASYGKHPKEVVLTWDTKNDWEYEVYRNTIKKIGGATEKLISEPSSQRKVGNVSDTDGFTPSVSVYYYYLKIRNRKDKYTVGYSQIIAGAPMFMAQSNHSLDNTFNSETMHLVGMVPFSSIELKDSIVGRAISELTTTTLIKSKRYMVIELDKWNLIALEKERLKGEDFLEKEIIRQGKALGADFLVEGKVINAEVYGKGSEWASQVDFTLKTIDVRTGRYLDANEFKGVYSSNSGLFSGAETFSKIFVKAKGFDTVALNSSALTLFEDDKFRAIKGALIDATRNTARKVDRWLNKTTNLKLQLLKIEKEVSKDIEFIIEGGEDVNMEKGDKLRIVTIQKIERGDNEAPVYHEKILAHIEVTDISSNSAICKLPKNFNPLSKERKELEKKLAELSPEELSRCIVKFD